VEGSWFRLYTEIRADPKLRRLPPAQRWAWIVVLALAKESPRPGWLLLAEGLPLHPQDLADQARISLKEARDALASFARQDMVAEEEGVLRVIHWERRQFVSDNSTGRWESWKKRKKGNVTNECQNNANVSPTVLQQEPHQRPANVGPTAQGQEVHQHPTNVGPTELHQRLANVGQTPPEYRVQRQTTETEKDINPSPSESAESDRPEPTTEPSFPTQSPDPSLISKLPGPALIFPPEGSDQPGLSPGHSTSDQAITGTSPSPTSPSLPRPKRSREGAPAKGETPPSVLLFRQETHRYPARQWFPEIEASVGSNPDELERWRLLVHGWVGAGWNPLNVAGMLELFRRHEMPHPGSRKEKVNDAADFARGLDYDSL
jgi:hypothetical protein